MKKREHWGTKLGIIFAVAGSAVGLGNFLRFPGQVCQNGGGAFLIPYFISFILLGIPLCWIEWTMGRYGGKYSHGSLPGILDAVVKKPWAKYVGVLGLFVPLIIFFYYTYIESWCLSYSFFSLFGSYKQISNPVEMGDFLNKFRLDSFGRSYLFFIITFIINMIVIYRGLSRGIEFLCKIAMPILAIGALILIIRIFTLGAPIPEKPDQNILNALGFMWNPNFGALKNPKVWMAAAGQIFFTLSVGLGAIMTYASYLKKKEDVALSSLTACSMNGFMEVILGGSLVIPAAFLFFGAVGAQEMSQSIFDLGFITMPCVLNQIPWGELFGFFWFFLLFIAGVTSSISIMQPIISFLEDEFSWTRKKAATTLGIVSFIATHFCILGLASGVLDEFDFWGGTFAITICAFIEIMVFIIFFGIKRGWEELHKGGDIKYPNFLKYIFYVTPVYLGAIILYWAVFNWIPIILKPFGIEIIIQWSKTFPFIMITSGCAAVQPIILLTRLGLLVFLGLLVLLIWLAWRRKKN